MAGLAQFERDVTGERTKTTLDHLKMQGRRWNHTPYGYKIDEKDIEGKQLIKDGREQKAIKLMKQMRTNNFSYADIAYELDLVGYKPKKADSWSLTAVWKELKNV